MYDVIILGAGPAGMNAGLYAARAGQDTVLLERMTAGGQMALTSVIENYPGFTQGVGGLELGAMMERQAVGAGVRLVYETALEIDCAGRRVRTASGWLESKRLILAMGARAKSLGVPGEERLAGRGISYCATCDGALYRGKRVAVIGGGNSAAEDALYLAGIGCEVVMVHRRDSLRAETAVARRVLEHASISVLWNNRVAAFEGEAKLTQLLLEDGTAVPVNGAFVAIGRAPETELVRGQVEMDEYGFIRAGEDCRTSVSGVYVAGDARAKTLRQVVTAVADGAMAAEGIGG